MRFAQVERRGTDEIADVFDHEQAALDRRELAQRVSDHAGVEVASLSRVDLDGARAGRPDAVGVERSLLVAFDHRDRHPPAQRLDRAHEQRRLPRSRARHEIEREDRAIGEQLPVPRRVLVVPREDVLLDLQRARPR